jgi:hypothetical protein
MKPADDKNHNLEFLIAMSNQMDIKPEKDTPDKREEIKRIVDNLNEFYAEHGRMPNQTELDVTLDTGGSVGGSRELTYEQDGDQA